MINIFHSLIFNRVEFLKKIGEQFIKKVLFISKTHCAQNDYHFLKY